MLKDSSLVNETKRMAAQLLVHWRKIHNQVSITMTLSYLTIPLPLQQYKINNKKLLTALFKIIYRPRTRTNRFQKLSSRIRLVWEVLGNVIWSSNTMKSTRSITCVTWVMVQVPSSELITQETLSWNMDSSYLLETHTWSFNSRVILISKLIKLCKSWRSNSSMDLK